MRYINAITIVEPPVPIFYEPPPVKRTQDIASANIFRLLSLLKTTLGRSPWQTRWRK